MDVIMRNDAENLLMLWKIDRNNNRKRKHLLSE